MLEEFDLAEALLGGFESLIGAAEISAFAGNCLIASLYSDNQGNPSICAGVRAKDGASIRRGR